MESHTAQFQWLVPESSGMELISFAIDTNSPDANPSNDITEAFIYVGRLPIADIDVPDNQLTLSQVVIDARSSFDPDGGTVSCKMDIETPDGEYQSLQGCQQTKVGRMTEHTTYCSPSLMKRVTKPKCQLK